MYLLIDPIEHLTTNINLLISPISQLELMTRIQNAGNCHDCAKFCPIPLKFGNMLAVIFLIKASSPSNSSFNTNIILTTL